MLSKEEEKKHLVEENDKLTKETAEQQSKIKTLESSLAKLIEEREQIQARALAAQKAADQMESAPTEKAFEANFEQQQPKEEVVEDDAVIRKEEGEFHQHQEEEQKTEDVVVEKVAEEVVEGGEEVPVVEEAKKKKKNKKKK
jgi:hypothetical protein